MAKHIRDVYDLSALYHNQEYNDYLHSEDFLDAMYRVTIEDGLNKNSRSHLSLADAPIFKDAEAVMALPEVATAYATDLKKLTFDKSKMPPIGKAVEALKNLHEILVRFEAYRTKKQMKNNRKATWLFFTPYIIIYSYSSSLIKWHNSGSFLIR